MVSLGSSNEWKAHPQEGINDVLQKVENYLSGWRPKLLSFAGKVTLLHSVIYSIPIYYLYSCCVPIVILNKIDKVARSFLWSHREDTKKFHLIGWHQVTKPKKEGGLGISNLRLMQKALLGKIFFCIFDARDSNWTKWILLNYDLNLWQWDTSDTQNFSPLMNAVFKVALLIKETISFSNDEII